MSQGHPNTPSVWPNRAAFDARDHFRQRVFDDRDAKRGDFLEAFPAAGQQAFAFSDERWVELPLVERAFDDDRLEVIGDDVLGKRWIAADVALAGRVEHLGVEHADDVAQVQIAIGDFGHVLAANIAEITFFAFGHWEVESLGSRVKSQSIPTCLLQPQHIVHAIQPCWFVQSHSAASKAPWA